MLTMETFTLRLSQNSDNCYVYSLIPLSMFSFLANYVYTHTREATYLPIISLVNASDSQHPQHTLYAYIHNLPPPFILRSLLDPLLNHGARDCNPSLHQEGGLFGMIVRGCSHTLPGVTKPVPLITVYAF